MKTSANLREGFPLIEAVSGLKLESDIMITIDLIDEHFDQPEKPARLQALGAKPGRGRTQALPEAISASQAQQDVEHSHPGLFAALWLGIKSLLNR